MKWRSVFSEQLPFFLGIPALLWQGLFFYVPLFFIVFLSFKTGTFEYFLPFLSPLYGSVVIRSLLLALGTTGFCLIVAYPVAYWLALSTSRLKNVLFFFLFVPFWTNFLLHVYAWMFVLDRQGVVNTFLMRLGLIDDPLRLLHSNAAVMMVMVYCYLPFMILPIYTSLEKFDTRLQEASSDLGATWWQTFWRIVVPLSLSGVRSGIFLVLVPAFGEFAIPELVGGDKVMFAGSIVAHYTLHAKTVPLGAAFTLLISLVLIVVLYGVYRIIKRQTTYLD